MACGPFCHPVLAIGWFDCYVEYKIIRLWKYSSGSQRFGDVSKEKQCAFMSFSALICELVHSPPQSSSLLFMSDGRDGGKSCHARQACATGKGSGFEKGASVSNSTVDFQNSR